MPYFPMFIDLEKQPILVVGGGKVALRKLKKLEPYGPSATVVAPDILPELAALPDVNLCRRSFVPSDLIPRPALVIAATDDGALNRRISVLCKRRHIPVNVADDPSLCSFVFPALVQEGDFSAGISTGGASPTAAVYFKDRLAELLPENLEELLLWLKSKRQTLKDAVPEPDRRAAAFRRLFHACMEKGAPLTKEELEKNTVSPTGSVALVGAGCGRADLITLRGLTLLRQCQAVVYDDLIDTALLHEAPESAQRIYMGKRSGSHSASQSEIERKLIELAHAGLQVVRLKGGDPYLFGRGGEEMSALRTAGVPCQEVPGIPSAIGIPAEAGIPVTHRSVSRSLHIVTAHTADTPDSLPEDLDTLAKLSGTLVFLMGLKQLPRITERLMAAGKDGNTPGAVISGGSAPHPALIRAPLAHLAEAAKNTGITAPAVILIGDVAAMDLTAAPEPLKGLTIGVTGTKAVAVKQLNSLQALGAQALWVFRSDIKDLSPEPAVKALKKNPHWIVFTSANGVDAFFRQAAEKNADLSFLTKHNFAVIGETTGAALAKYGFRAALCPKIFTSEALAKELAGAAKPAERILLLRSAMATGTLPDILRKAGFSVDDIPIYTPEYGSFTEPLPKMDYLTFSSSGGVAMFFERFGEIPKDTCPVCIGGVTANTLSRYTDEAYLTAAEISADGIVKAILGDISKKG